MRHLLEILGDLADAFPRQPVKPSTLRIYAKHLDDFDEALAAAAVDDLIRTSEFFPTIAEIRRRAAELHLGIPDEEEALGQIEARLAWARNDAETRGDAPAVHPDVRHALDHVGGWHAFRTAEEPGVVRGQFLRLYRDRRAVEIRSVQSGATVRSLGAGVTARALDAGGPQVG